MEALCLEMNLHLPQSITTANELWNIARVPTQIVTPQTNGPIIGIVQDSLLGAFLMTRYTTKIHKSLVMNILAQNDSFDFKNLPKPDADGKWRGKQLVSTIIPPINIQKTSNSFDENKTDTTEEYKQNAFIKINNGVLESGSIDKSILGAKKPNSFAHIIKNDFGLEQAKDFLSLIQKFTNKFLVTRGFSVGIGDIMPSKKLTKKMDNIILKGITEIKELVERIDNHTYIPPVNMTTEEYFEIEATEKLNELTLSVASEALKTMNPETNGLMGMITSGSKGEAINVGQMMGCVGQQIVDRHRIGKLFGHHRTLPFFHRDDMSPKSRGFVEHSFVQGLDPVEFFQHSMTGREGIIDTAIRTADSGYISRRLMKLLEDIFVNYDNTVRNGNGQIIQYMYGEDGINTIQIEKQKIETLFMNNREIEENFKYSDKDAKQLNLSTAELNEANKEYKKIQEDRDVLRFILMKADDDIEDYQYLPVNIQRLLVNAKNQFNTSKDDKLKPKEVIEKLEQLIEKLPRLFYNQLNTDIELPDNARNAVTIFSILLRSSLASKRVIMKHKLNHVTFDYVLNQIETKFLNAIVDPGEMVGGIAAQSLGEPSTQLSVEYNTKIIMNKNTKKIKNVKIGKFIDKIINNAKKEDIELQKGETIVVSLKNYKHKYNVPTVGADDEKMIWKPVLSVTRHPPNGKLVHIKTKYGREVTATLAKSFLTRKDNKIVATNGSDLKIGDRLPIMKNMPKNECKIINYIDILKYIDKTKYRDINGYIHPNKIQNKMIKIPRKIKLNEEFGFFIGAFLAEGTLAKYFVYIANVDKVYQEKIVNFAKLFNITNRVVIENLPNNSVRGKIVLSSILISEIMYKLCSHGSENKHLPDFIYNAPIEFIKGVLMGYFDGDGTMTKCGSLESSSDSEKLTDGLILLLSKFGIFAGKRVRFLHNKNRYEILVRSCFTKIYAKEIGSCINYKSDNLNKLLNKEICSSYEIIPGINHPEIDSSILSKNKLKKLINDPKINDKDILLKAYHSDVFWDPIVELEYIDCKEKYVYDITVKDNPVFCDNLGTVLNDTLNTST